MRDLITRMNTVPSVSYPEVKAVVDREGQTENGACLIQWMSPNWYRVGLWNGLDGRWEYTGTLDWAQAVKCLRGYGLL
jgi:hypothetical protein